MLKISQEINMSFQIGNDDKNLARQASEALIQAVNQAKIIDEHLNLFENSFENIQNIDREYLKRKRGIFARYGNEAEINFKKLQIFSATGIRLLKNFEIDSKIDELIKGLTEIIEQLNKIYQDFIKLLNDTDNDNFHQEILDKIKLIKDKLDNFKNFVKERIIEHLDQNFLAKNWMEHLDQQEVLVNTNSATLDTSKRQQLLNPAYQQQILYPNDRRISNRQE